jgi:hypothetical protein
MESSGSGAHSLARAGENPFWMECREYVARDGNREAARSLARPALAMEPRACQARQ